MHKGTLPVPYIIAIVLGIAILALMGHLFFQQSGSLGRESSKQDCLLAVAQYCSFYDPNKFWDTKYGSKLTQQNCMDYQAGKYSPCSQFVEAKPIELKPTTKKEDITVDAIREVKG